VNQSNSARAVVDHGFTQVVGLRAWAPSVGVGSFLTIEFGNPRISSTGTSQGEFHLWVYGASWEIRERTRTIASSSDDHAAMVAGAQVLDGAPVRSFEFNRERMTLSLRFDPSVELAVTPLGDLEMEEWFLYLDDGTVITVGPGETVTHESASGFQRLPNGQADATRPDNV
jgi:hypothetical protein